MRKRSGLLARCVFALLAACAALCVAGCASSPRAGSVEPLDVLPPEAALYVYVPVAQYQDFARAVLKGAASGMSDKDSERVLSRTEDVYLALDAQCGAQLAVRGSYPQAAVKAALSAKRGWQKHTLAAGTACADTAALADGEAGDAGDVVLRKPYTYYTRADLPLELSFPRAGLLVAGSSVQPLIARYDSALFTQSAAQKSGTGVYAYLSEPQTAEIRFASPDAAALLALLAEKLNPALSLLSFRAVYGSLRHAAADADSTLSLTLELEDARTLRATAAMLKLALLAVQAEVSAAGEASITVTVTVPWQTVLSSFTTMN